MHSDLLEIQDEIQFPDSRPANIDLYPALSIVVAGKLHATFNRFKQIEQ